MKSHQETETQNNIMIKSTQANAPALPRGMFHLVYDEDWEAEYICDECLAMLNCSRDAFWPVFLSAYPLSPSQPSAWSMGSHLEALSTSFGTCSFVGLLWNGRESLPYLQGTLTVVPGKDNRLSAYGVLVDRTAFYTQEEHLHFLEEEYQASLQMSARSLYHYLIDGRRAIIPPEIARKANIPEVIENLPEWNVSEGRIAPQSVQDWYGIFDAIDRGEERGSAEVLFCLRSGEQRRVSVEFTSINNGKDKPVSAIVSHLDITDQYEFNRKQGLDRDGLLQVSRLVFPEILTMNLTRKTYRMIQYYQATTLGTPQEGTLEQMLAPRFANLAPEDAEAFKDTFFPEALMEAIKQGKNYVQLAYRRIGQDGIWHWVETIAMRQDNPFDDDILVIAVSRNIDKEKQSEETLRQALVNAYEYELAEEKRINAEERLKQNEQIFPIVAQHSSRTLCYYDLATRSFRPWSEDSPESSIFPHLFHNSYSRQKVLQDKYILPESVAGMNAMFEDIHKGKPFGEANIHLKLADKTKHWFHFKYSLIFQGNEPVTALISFADVTQQHEKDISYLRFIHSIGEHAEDHLGYVEVDLTTNVVEKHVGSPRWQEGFVEGSAYDDQQQRVFADFIGSDSLSAVDYYSLPSLIQRFEEGLYDFEDIWQIRAENQDSLWIKVRTELLCDSLSEHIKMFAHLTDITSAKEAQLAISRRADYDAMTGLLRRDSGIEQIQQLISAPEDKAGILILLDLDDLKGINDTLGHAQGDLAIASIAETLTGHFRSDDILVRIGGDEFMVFLPGAAGSVSSVALAMSSLLKKLAGISIGENRERCIHCSAGCAVQVVGEDDFDSLYRRADIALYHVKRNGKNNFAFFEPEMLLEDYQFKMNQTAPKARNNLEREEINQLLETISLHFQAIVFFDLSKNQYRIVETEDNAEPVSLSNNIDTFWKNTLEKIHPDDRKSLEKALFRDTLMSAFIKGKPTVKHHFRCQDSDGSYYSSDVEVNFYTGQTGDIYAFALFSRTQTPETELEILRLKKILEMSGRSDFEYICLINVRTGKYSTYSQDGSNSHAIPEAADFDTVTRHIRDTQIAPKDREAYYQAAVLKNVLKHVHQSGGYYSYHYRLPDGTRQASFTWYEASHTELLMTVKKIS